MMWIHDVARGIRRHLWAVGVAMAALQLSPLPMARAGVVQPELSVVGGTGVPGGTVSVTLNLADDTDNAAVSVGVDLRFDDTLLNFSLPVAENCTLSERLQTTHGVAGNILEPGLLNVEVFVLGAPDPKPPLGNGEIVTCNFGVKPDAPVGVSPIEIESPLLGDTEGMPIFARITDGQVEIVAEIATPTPTETATPEVTGTPTETATPEVTGTPTDTATPEVTGTPTDTATPEVTGTPTNTPTREVTNTRTSTPTPEVTGTPTDTETPEATHTSTATRTRTHAPPSAGDDGCNVVPPGQSSGGGTLVLMLAPALLIWVRRRRF